MLSRARKTVASGRWMARQTSTQAMVYMKARLLTKPFTTAAILPQLLSRARSGLTASGVAKTSRSFHADQGGQAPPQHRPVDQANRQHSRLTVGLPRQQMASQSPSSARPGTGIPPNLPKFVTYLSSHFHSASGLNSSVCATKSVSCPQLPLKRDVPKSPWTNGQRSCRRQAESLKRPHRRCRL
jgi:hypothetical protein